MSTRISSVSTVAQPHSLPDHSSRKVSPATRAFIERHLPPSLHKFAPLVAGAVSSRVEWMDKDGQNSARAICCLIVVQAQERWRAEHPEYSEAQFAAYAKLCVQRVTRWFLPEIKERQWQNQERWSRKNERARHRRQELWERHRAKRRKVFQPPHSPKTSSPPRRTPLLCFSTQEEQEDHQARFGVEAVVYSAWNDEGNPVSAVRFSSSMRLVDKARLLLFSRERELMRRLDDGESLTEICRGWNISIPRGTQIKQQAMARMEKYLLRHQAGETFDALLREVRRSERTATRKINTARRRQQENL